jgi:hypothetical protein
VSGRSASVVAMNSHSLHEEIVEMTQGGDVRDFGAP